MKKEDLIEVMHFRLSDIIEQARKAKNKLEKDDTIHYEVNCLVKGIELLNFDFEEAVRLDFY